MGEASEWAKGEGCTKTKRWGWGEMGGRYERVRGEYERSYKMEIGQQKVRELRSHFILVEMMFETFSFNKRFFFAVGNLEVDGQCYVLGKKCFDFRGSV